MSEAKGPFDYVFVALREEINTLNYFKERIDLIPSIKTAIRVLEAAGKVDKAMALTSLRDAGNGLPYSREGMAHIYALLKALPDAKERA